MCENDSVKIDVDFSSAKELLRIKRDLEAALAAVNGALAANRDFTHPPLENEVNPSLSLLSDEESSTFPPPTPSDVIGSLPMRFTMREARDRAEGIGMSDGRIRNEIGRQLESGILVELEKGKGTRPSIYRKVVAVGISGAAELAASVNNGSPLTGGNKM